MVRGNRFRFPVYPSDVKVDVGRHYSIVRETVRTQSLLVHPSTLKVGTNCHCSMRREMSPSKSLPTYFSDLKVVVGLNYCGGCYVVVTSGGPLVIVLREGTGSVAPQSSPDRSSDLRVEIGRHCSVGEVGPTVVYGSLLGPEVEVIPSLFHHDENGVVTPKYPPDDFYVLNLS